MLKLFFCFCVLTSVYMAQTDWEYWKKNEPSYIQIPSENTMLVDREKNFTDQLISGAKSLYSFFISDLDGDNCPFQPTCSEFFVQAAHKTNLIKSVLMFTDRFTRDINLSKGPKQYLLTRDGHYSDPVDNYLLNLYSIHNIPVQEE